LPASNKKLRFLLKPDVYVPLILFFLLLVCAGFVATTQESDADTVNDDYDEYAADEYSFIDDEADEDEFEVREAEPVWAPPGPPRWFRSNAGGMALEEIPSRLAAQRNKYALVIDYVSPEELEPFLLPFFNSGYAIQIRVLYEQGEETRRQWLFLDEAEVTRLNAVFRPLTEEAEQEIEAEIEDGLETEASLEAEAGTGFLTGTETGQNAGEEIPGAAPAPLPDTGTDPALDSPAAVGASADASADAGIEAAADASADAGTEAAADSVENAGADDGTGASFGAASGGGATGLSGFIEVFDEQSRITGDYLFQEDGGEIQTAYFYNGSALVLTETLVKSGGEDSEPYRKIFTDHYRYNRSFSLRHVERVYHEAADVEPVRLVFPGRVLEAAGDMNFIREKLPLESDFFGSYRAGDGYRIDFDTDSRGRILSQTMYTDNDEEVWRIENTWSGDRIIAISKTEGEDVKITEYEYGADGSRIIQREISNGVLERLIRTDGNKETEELYLDGIMVLKAYWEDGRKISEERVRRR